MGDLGPSLLLLPPLSGSHTQSLAESRCPRVHTHPPESQWALCVIIFFYFDNLKSFPQGPSGSSREPYNTKYSVHSWSLGTRDVLWLQTRHLCLDPVFSKEESNDIHLIILDYNWLQVTETTESKTMDKGDCRAVDPCDPAEETLFIILCPCACIRICRGGGEQRRSQVLTSGVQTAQAGGETLS